jgi:hypothetical protein
MSRVNTYASGIVNACALLNSKKQGKKKYLNPKTAKNFSKRK